MLYDDYLRLVESSKQEIEKVRSKTQLKNSETRATPEPAFSFHGFSPAVSTRQAGAVTVLSCVTVQ